MRGFARVTVRIVDAVPAILGSEPTYYRTKSRISVVGGISEGSMSFRSYDQQCKPIFACREIIDENINGLVWQWNTVRAEFGINASRAFKPVCSSQCF